jgi:hypothetical protein
VIRSVSWSGRSLFADFKLNRASSPSLSFAERPLNANFLVALQPVQHLFCRQMQAKSPFWIGSINFLASQFDTFVWMRAS